MAVEATNTTNNGDPFAIQCVALSVYICELFCGQTIFAIWLFGEHTHKKREKGNGINFLYCTTENNLNSFPLPRRFSAFLFFFVDAHARPFVLMCESVRKFLFRFILVHLIFTLCWPSASPVLCTNAITIIVFGSRSSFGAISEQIMERNQTIVNGWCRCGQSFELR